MSTRNYAVTDDARSQRTNAINARWAKADFVKNLNAILPKMKLHLDDQLRLNEIAQCVKKIFPYEDITCGIYVEEHTDFLNEHDASMKQELDSVKQEYENRIEELQKQIKHIEDQNDVLQLECETLKKRNAKLEKKIAEDKMTYEKTASVLKEKKKKKRYHSNDLF
jgi:predicted RNase H-like nuclease (RuvC/YqgF family)